MSAKRFWGRGVETGGWTVLDKDSLKHAKVARLREGEEMELIDGRGNFWRGVFEREGIRVKKFGTVERKLPEVILAVGTTQGGTMEDIVRQATELGVSEIVPLKTRNSAPEREEKRMEAKLERWERIVAEACKQTGQYWKPRVWPQTIISQVVEQNLQAKHVVAAIGEKVTPWAKVSFKDVERIVVWIGPEGDFAAEEYERLRGAGAVLVALGETVLRTETACVSALARVAQRVEALRA